VEVREYVSLSIDKLAFLIDRYKTDRSQSRPDVGERGGAVQLQVPCTGCCVAGSRLGAS
jgi:hypothetical protein